MGTQALLKNIFWSVIALKSDVQKPQAVRESLKCRKEKTTPQCSLFAKSTSTITGDINKQAFHLFQASALEVESRVKQWPGREKTTFEQFATNAVPEWTNRTDHDVKM